MTGVVNFDALHSIITSGSSGLVDVQADLARAQYEIEWALSHPAAAATRTLEPETWITPEQAAEIAAVDRRTIYDWATGKAWASRKSRRCLRIAEGPFRRWMAAR